MPSRVERSKRRAKGYGYCGEHFTEEDWLELLEKCGGRCLLCGATEDFSVDHVIPLSWRGEYTRQLASPVLRV